MADTVTSTTILDGEKDFIVQLTNISDGTGERDYIHISDVVLGHFFALEKIDKIKRHEAYNLGTGKSISVLKIIKIFERVNNIKIKK